MWRLFVVNTWTLRGGGMEKMGMGWEEGVCSGDCAKFIVEKNMFKCETHTYGFIFFLFFFSYWAPAEQSGTIKCLTNCTSPENSSTRTNTCWGWGVVTDLQQTLLCTLCDITESSAPKSSENAREGSNGWTFVMSVGFTDRWRLSRCKFAMLWRCMSAADIIERQGTPEQGSQACSLHSSCKITTNSPNPINSVGVIVNVKTVFLVRAISVTISVQFSPE